MLISGPSEDNQALYLDRKAMYNEISVKQAKTPLTRQVMIDAVTTTNSTLHDLLDSLKTVTPCNHTPENCEKLKKKDVFKMVSEIDKKPVTAYAASNILKRMTTDININLGSILKKLVSNEMAEKIRLVLVGKKENITDRVYEEGSDEAENKDERAL